MPIGTISLVTALIAWALLLLGLYGGGLDPGSSLLPLLKYGMAAAVCGSVLAFGLGIGALGRGRQRIAGGAGLALSLLFLLLFTGVGFTLFR